jgi:hypothetical protein
LRLHTAYRTALALALVLALVVSAAAVLPFSQESTSPESVSAGYDLRAAFLVRLVEFVEWPSAAAPAPGGVINVCVVGSDPFGPELQRLALAASTPERPLQGQRVRTAADAVGVCHVAYIARSRRLLLRRDLAQLRAAPVLTVGEHPAFIEEGGIIAFRSQDTRIRLAISLAAAKRAQLKISSRLLDVAEIVDDRAP